MSAVDLYGNGQNTRGVNSALPSFDPRSQTHNSAMGIYRNRVDGLDGGDRIVRTSSNFGSGSVKPMTGTFERRG